MSGKVKTLIIKSWQALCSCKQAYQVYVFVQSANQLAQASVGVCAGFEEAQLHI